MKSARILCLDTEKLFERAAKDFVDKIDAVLSVKSAANIALPGGNSIVGLLKILSQPCYADILHNDSINIYLTDERISDKPDELNAVLLKRLLRELSPGQLHLDLQHEYEKFNSEEISFDIIVLGVGEDGHIASIFPGDSTALLAETTYVTIQNAPKLPPNRVTLTSMALQTADMIYLLFVGVTKRQAVENFVNDHIDSGDCPAKICLDLGNAVTAFTDIKLQPPHTKKSLKIELHTNEI